MTIAQIFVPIQHYRDDCVCLGLFTTTTPVALSTMTMVQYYHDDSFIIGIIRMKMMTMPVSVNKYYALFLINSVHCYLHFRIDHCFANSCSFHNFSASPPEIWGTALCIRYTPIHTHYPHVFGHIIAFPCALDTHLSIPLCVWTHHCIPLCVWAHHCIHTPVRLDTPLHTPVRRSHIIAYLCKVKTFHCFSQLRFAIV